MNKPSAPMDRINSWKLQLTTISPVHKCLQHESRAMITTLIIISFASTFTTPTITLTNTNQNKCLQFIPCSALNPSKVPASIFISEQLLPKQLLSYLLFSTKVSIFSCFRRYIGQVCSLQLRCFMCKGTTSSGFVYKWQPFYSLSVQLLHIHLFSYLLFSTRVSIFSCLFWIGKR